MICKDSLYSEIYFHRVRSHITVEIAKIAFKHHETPYFARNWRPECCSGGSENRGGLKACDKPANHKTESQNMAFFHFYRSSSTMWRFLESVSEITTVVDKTP